MTGIKRPSEKHNRFFDGRLSCVRQQTLEKTGEAMKGIKCGGNRPVLRELSAGKTAMKPSKYLWKDFFTAQKTRRDGLPRGHFFRFSDMHKTDCMALFAILGGILNPMDSHCLLH